MIASYEAYGEDVKKVISSAIALEMIHTYSLIHDDLPAMDDDDYRRGKLTNHKVFDEATAILAGDALLTYSFEIVANDPLLEDKKKVVSLEELERIHTYKTGELIKFAIYTGAYLGNASRQQLAHLKDFAYYLGLIFQVQDDILDIVGDEEKIGKAIGSDLDNHKST